LGKSVDRACGSEQTTSCCCWSAVPGLRPQIAWRLHRMALNAAHTNAFVGLAIDGKQKKIAQTANLWSIMRGNAADSDTPTVTLDFEFVWQVCVADWGVLGWVCWGVSVVPSTQQ
jgi:hypothetical protein